MADDVRDGAGNLLIRGDNAGNRGMDPKKPFFTRSVDANGADVGGGGGGGSGGTQAAPGYVISVSDTAGTQPLGTPATAAYADPTAAAAGTVIGLLKGAYKLLAGTLLTRKPKQALLTEGVNVTSATAGTATQVAAADANRTKVQFQNLGTATIALRINEGADTTVASSAAVSASGTKRFIYVPASQLYVSEDEDVVTGLISVASGTASIPYAFKLS